MVVVGGSFALPSLPSFQTAKPTGLSYILDVTPPQDIPQGNWTTSDAFISHDVFDGYWHHLAIAVEDTKSDALL